MKFIPDSLSRTLARQVLLARKNSPTILFGAGVVCMVGSTALACHATLKLEAVLDDVERNKDKAKEAKHLVDSGQTEMTYTDAEMAKDLRIISIRGIGNVVKLYAPAVVLGGIGIACLTKSHKILMQRNSALTAAYIAVDAAFRSYRERVIDRYGEETDRELRYDMEDVEVIDEETGKVITAQMAPTGEPQMYARWFDGESSRNWTAPPHDGYNWVYLRDQQNWANDMLRSRGHVFLNEVYSLLGLSHTSAGQIVGWVYERDNPNGDNYIDFGFSNQEHHPDAVPNGREGAILLDFNVDGSVWQLIDDRQRQRELESGPKPDAS